VSGAAAERSRRARAPFGRRGASVVDSLELGAYRVIVAADPDGPRPRPGQFYMLMTPVGWGGEDDERPFLGRAFSVLRAPASGDQDQLLMFLLEDVGPGTARLCELESHDELSITGPLGVGFSAPADGGRALLVGGGVGIAPLAIWQDELLARKAKHRVLLGFRDAAHAEGATLLADARVATDDGSVGHHGLVTDLLQAELESEPAVTVYSCGPPPMLEAVRAMCAARAAPAQLALESGMACGFGACFGCVVPTRAGYLRVCVDGPVVDAALLETALAPGH
jgi:dihydroorotate dehydrogenase electron transfer subunit